MTYDPEDTSVYICPMHAGVRESRAGKCPRCGMVLVREGAPFPFVQHMIGNPSHLVVMVAAMAAIMGTAMMLVR
jgi:Heavy metal binding domain